MMKKIRKNSTYRLIAGIVLGIFLMSSCESEKREQVDEGDLPEVVSFQEHIIPIFNMSCNTSSCHGGRTPPDLTPEYAYSDLINGNYLNVDDPPNSSLYIKIDEGSMEVYATDLDRALILKWIDQEALDN